MESLARYRALAEIGTEPDPRFSFANERTFLAWTRTALALMVAGGAVAQFAVSAGPVVRGTLAALLIAMGAFVALVGYARWRRAEVALRLDRPLPHGEGLLYLAAGLAVLGAMSVGAVLFSFLT